MSKEKSPGGLSSDSLTLNTNSITQSSRQVILDLLSEYRELEKPVNPDLLKIFIDNATDRLETIYKGNDLVARDKEPI
jgi:hypothetical protein